MIYGLDSTRVIGLATPKLSSQLEPSSSQNIETVAKIYFHHIYYLDGILLSNLA